MKLNQFGDTVRLAILGLGCRGVGQMKVLLDMPDVQIAAVCDAYADRVESAREIVREAWDRRPLLHRLLESNARIVSPLF